MGGIKNRGFASMTPERLREVASKGGRNSGGNFKHDPERARIIGRKGGLANRKEEQFEALESEPNEEL